MAINHYYETTGRRMPVTNWLDLGFDVIAELDTPTIHAEEAETSLALALGQRVDMDRATETRSTAATPCAMPACRGRRWAATTPSTAARR